MTRNLVSVIITCHNYGKYLPDLFRSIVSQSYKNIEIIAVNDASSDDSGVVLQLLKKTYSKNIPISIINNLKNIGVSASFEKGLRIAKGEFIAVCDADDVWLEEKIEAQVKGLKTMNLDMIYTDMIVVDTNLHKKSDSFMKSSLFYFVNQNKDTFGELLYANHIPGPTILFRSAFKNMLIPFSKHAIQDEWISWILSGNDCRIGYIPQATVLYRQHGKNMIGGENITFSSLFFDPTLLKKHINNKQRLVFSLRDLNLASVLPKYRSSIVDLIKRQDTMLAYFYKIMDNRCKFKDFLEILFKSIRYYSLREVAQVIFFYGYYLSHRK